MNPPSGDTSPRRRIALAGGGTGAAMLLDMLLEWREAAVVVVADPEPEAPAVARARALGIAIASRYADVLAYPVDLVLDATGHPAVLDELVAAKPAGVEVIGAAALDMLWRLLRDKVTAERQLKAQVDVAAAVGSTLNMSQQAVVVTRALAEACGVDRCSIFLYEDEDGLVNPLESQFAGGSPNEPMRRAFKDLGRMKLRDVPFFYEIIERRTPIEIDTPSATSLLPQGWAELFEFKSVLVVPIFAAERVVGACLLDYAREHRAFTAEQVGLAATLVEHVARGFENVNVYHRAEMRADKLTALSTLTRLMTAAPVDTQVFHAVAEAAAVLLWAATARVWVDDPLSGQLRTEGSFGMDPQVERLMTEFPAIPYGQGLVGRIFQSRTPEYVLDIGQDNRWLNRRLATEGGLRAFAGLPLIANDRVVGVLVILFREARHFSPEEKELMGLLADQAAVALENARLYSEAMRRRREAEELARVARMLTESLDVRAVADAIALNVLSVCGAASSALYVTQPDGSLKALTWGGRARDHFEVGEVFPPGFGIMGRALSRRAPAWTQDILADPDVLLSDEHRARIIATGNRALLAVPLWAKGEIMGVLSIADGTPRAFSEAEIVLLQTFADQAALALENARLYQRAQQAYDELAHAQAQLVRGETLRAIGELASGAAHHLNNLLAVVVGRLQLALARPAGLELREHLVPAERAAQDGAEVVRRLSRFSRNNTEPRFVALDLNQLAEEVVELTRPRWQNEAEMRGVRNELMLVPGTIPRVAGDPPSLREVLVNLVLNAVDAMPEGGRITITTWSVDGRVNCAVRDGGIGMSVDVQRRVLEPFFTTKGVKSTGLGLSVNYGIVHRHGGEMTIESAEGKGTVVTFWLPVATDAGTPPIAVLPPAPASRRILVIDDEEAVRSTLVSLLTLDGHRVVEAADGYEGLARLADDPPPDLVMTDLGMPGMTGWEVIRAVKAARPALPVGLVTGWGEEPEGPPADQLAADFIVAKPVTRESLRLAIAQASHTATSC